MFRSPIKIDVTQTTAVDTPESFRSEIREPRIDVLPLVSDIKGSQGPGWCTYTYQPAEAPELEIICCGINSKTSRAGAVWRQGNLLHFGFEPSPARLNAAGKALLINSICYIAGFTEDRPIVRTPCGFVGGHWITDRGAIDRWLARPSGDLKDLQYYIAQESYAKVAGKGRAEFADWYKQARGFLHAGADGRLTVDAEAEAFGVPPSTTEFATKAIAAVADQDRSQVARRLLVRYIPDGPGADATVDQWSSWWNRNEPYLFFSDTGGYRWYIDPLAQRRGQATALLRGPARATRPISRN